jgi:phage terminase large subunit
VEILKTRKTSRAAPTTKKKTAKQLAVEQLSVVQRSYEAFIEKILGVATLEVYQRKVIRAVEENERVAVSACHDVGKTFLAARLAITFLSNNPGSKVITTAPTYNQVKRILWSELRSAHRAAKIPLGGVLNETDWTFEPDWFAIGFTPKNELSGGEGQGTQSSFQGFHAPGGLLLIFDEATGIPANIWTMAEGLMTQHKVKFLAIGNPTSTTSEFYRCFKDPAWFKVYLSCFDSPNLKANNINTIEELQWEIDKVTAMNDADAKKHLDSYKMVVPYLLTTKWVVQNAKKWGINHPLTVSKILGKFPHGGDNTLLPLGFVEEAQLRVYYPKDSERKTIGVDVARFGSDSTVLTGLHGFKQLSRREFYKHDALEVVGEVINLSREMDGVDVIVVDETGVGGGVVDLLNDAVKTGALPKTTEIRGVQFGAACELDEDKEKYANLKARMFGLLQQDLKKDDGLAILNESVYLEELPTILYKYNQKGQMVIESKDDYKKRTGRKSPDNADSLALANFGHYDEMNAGTFTNKLNDSNSTSTSKTLSGGFRSQRDY